MITRNETCNNIAVDFALEYNCLKRLFGIPLLENLMCSEND